MKHQNADGPKIFMRVSKKYTHANRSLEKIFTISSRAFPYGHEQHEVPLLFSRTDNRLQAAKTAAVGQQITAATNAGAFSGSRLLNLGREDEYSGRQSVIVGHTGGE
jgi:hypothetical protein